MGSKKQRGKAAKPRNTLPAAIASSSSSANQDNILDRAPIKADHVSPGNSLFLRKLPREIRDKIYEELLIVKMTPSMAAHWDDQLKKAARMGDYGVKRAQNFLDQALGLLPGGSGNYASNFIGRKKGILQANKQIYEEATSVLFGKNLSAILPESERIWSFWRCDSLGCEPVDRTCFVRPETASKIKHLLVLVSNTRNTTDREMAQGKKRLQKNLQTVVGTLPAINIKLKTLSIRYWSCFGGEIESIRDVLEGPSRLGMPDSPFMMRYVNGKFSSLRRLEAEESVFRHARQVLEPLRGLKHSAEDVEIRGDLPQALVDELTEALNVDDSVVKKQMKEQKAKEANQKQPRNASTDLADFALDQPEQNPNANADTRRMWENLTKTSIKSPAVMAELFKQPTKEEMERAVLASRHRRSANTATISEVTSDDEQEQPQAVGAATSAAIGFIAGKSVFGPPRPPASGA